MTPGSMERTGSVLPSAEQPSQKLAPIPIVNLLTQAVAPAALAISAASYLCGFTFRAVLMRSFGLRSGVIDVSVQDTIALGFLPLIMFAIGCVIVGTLFVAVLNKIVPLLNVKRWRVETPPGGWGSFILLNVAGWIYLVLSLGAAAGLFWADRAASDIKSALVNGCRESCQIIRTTRGNAIGIVVAQSKDIAVIATRRATYIVTNQSIKSLSPWRKTYRAYGAPSALIGR